MKFTVIISILVLVVFSTALMSATDNDGPPGPGPTPLKFKIPPGWPKPTADIFSKNKLTEEGFQLGKRLFYDGQLSKDNETSCANCHQPFAAFASYDHDLSHGVNNSFTTRNAPALFNLAWMSSYHWDGGINHIEVQPLAPITAHNEMGETIDSILFKIKKDTTYRRMFKTAFGDQAITSQRLLKALAQFTGSLVSADSKYDKVKRGIDSFTVYEANGYQIFKDNCASCHKEPLFTDNEFHNNGRAMNRFKDVGRQRISLLATDSLKFKTPSLRNVQVTFPYFHDGSAYSLSKVIDHYQNGIIREQSTLDTILKKPIVMTLRQKNELIYFLYTLTDTSFTKNPRFLPTQAVTYKH